MAIFLCIEILVLLVTSVDIFGEIKKLVPKDMITTIIMHFYITLYMMIVK